MAPTGSRAQIADVHGWRDPRRSQPIHFTYVALGFLASGLFAPLASAPAAWRAISGRTVYLSVDGQSKSYTSAQPTVGEVLRERRISVAPGDRITPPSQTRIWPGIQISLVRAVPMTVTVGGERRRVRLAATSVAEVLDLLRVQLGPQDRVYPDLTAAPSAGMRISVLRRESRTWVERRAIPFVVQTVFDRDLLKGRQVVRAAGTPGLRGRTVQVDYVDGRAVSVVTMSDEVLKAPAPRVVAIGTRPLLATDGPYRGKEIVYFEASAYYSGPNNYGGGVGPRTAVGLMARHGVVAVDPSVIKLGTRLHIEGYGDAVAGDTGSAIRGNRIDLCFNSYDEAMRFGRRTVKAYILARP